MKKKALAPTLPPLRSGLNGFTCAETGRFVCTGAAGRIDTMPDAANRQSPRKLRLVRLRWVEGDYDQGGAYWGRSPSSDDIYRAIDCGDTRAEIFVRAKDRAEAKARVRDRLPNARFYR